MNYQETLDWLFAQLPMYQRVGQAAYKANLDNTLLLSDYLKHPEKAFKSIHVAGTNGKGSTSHMLASVLQEAGYKVGLYTSPHLKDFRERIKIDGKEIPKQKVTSFIKKHKRFFEEHQLSFFEMTVGLAFEFFRKEKVDIAVVEVGMGGRLDSTNIITPEVSVITNIGWDHTQFLGDTLAKIAAEKAGIIKPNIPVVVGETLPETKPVFEEIALKNTAEIVFAENESFDFYPSDLIGSYQKMNQKTVLTALKMLKQKGWKFSERDLKKGLKHVVENTGLLGRWQILQESPKVICDTAHNKEGLMLTMKQLASENYNNLHIVLGVVSDKDLSKVLPLFPKNATYYFCEPKIPRAMSVVQLQREANAFNLIGEPFLSVKSAYQSALKNAEKEDVVYVGGSTFVVAEVL
ncbi:bifunctional folylpolyglutamate synthase/dihydrofolate synthase [Aureisphaera sp. CAU 1614]|uniref:Dihydrofolate synthase/folylpolyglutamate synthase n=1 Tax=Halomarinibacterium sedimenti TaxID=2857106 RepID=A0A9X1JW77_9FLAO|nr:folylpolyglutamate synthase/dihydrofolate synthase family protein [Halomarinibacterium sedimenti]MBW2938794.1 bifunctional folylpolyglutamate synthase/dihydrofolate synthase [Halomarinibacterium sedimenti]